jgi:hypothetical protein
MIPDIIQHSLQNLRNVIYLKLALNSQLTALALLHLLRQLMETEGLDLPGELLAGSSFDRENEQVQHSRKAFQAAQFHLE